MSQKMQECLEFGRQCVKQLRNSGEYDPLVPRAVPAQAVSEFLASKQKDGGDGGYLIIEAEPGIGKTGFMLDLCSKAEICYTFQDRGWSADVRNFLNYLAAELHLILEKDTPLPRYCYNLDDAHERANFLLDRVGQNLGKDERLLIIGDALDEAYLGDRANAQLLKFRPTRGVYFVYTSRREERILDQLRPYPDVSVSPWSKNKRTITEVTDYIKNHLQTCTALEKQNLEVAADGNFRLLQYLLVAWERGDISLEKMPAKPLTLHTFFRDQWQNRILKKARMPDLCEDVATLLASAREPLSNSVITSAIRHQGVAKLKARDVEQSLTDIATFVEPVRRGELKRWRPYDASFGRWLEEFYAGDLCEAHRALALGLIEVLKSNSSPDFDIAAQNACWHLRQWAKSTVDTSQKDHARKILKNLIDDSKVREQVERQIGVNDYLLHFLYETVKYSEETGSFPDLIRFGTRYIERRRKAGTQLDQLETLLKDRRYFQALKIAQTLPEKTVQLGCLCLIGCWAIDNNSRSLLAKVLDCITAQPGRTPGAFSSIAWAFADRLAHLGERDLALRFLSSRFFMELGGSMDDYFYRVLQSWSKLPPRIDSVTPFLEALACQNWTWLPDYLPTVMEAALEKYGEDHLSTEKLVQFINSLPHEEAQLGAARALAELFVERNIPSYALDIVEIILDRLVCYHPWPFVDGVRMITAVLGRLNSHMDKISLYKRLLQAIHNYDRTFDFLRAEALTTILRYLKDVPSIDNFSTLQSSIGSVTESFDNVLFKDYVRVQLIALVCQHNSYADAVRQMDSINDPLCQQWAAALLFARALVNNAAIPARVKKVAKIPSRSTFSPTQLLSHLAKGIQRLAAKPVTAPAFTGKQRDRTAEVKLYPRLCILATADIASCLNKMKTVTEHDAETLGELLREGVRHAVEIPAEWGWSPYEAMALFLRQAEQIAPCGIRQRLLSMMLSNVRRLEPECRWSFLRDLAVVLEHTGDRRLFDELIEHLPEFVEKDDRLDKILDLMVAIRKKMSTSQCFRIVTSLLNMLAKFDSYTSQHNLAKVVVTIPKLLDADHAVPLLSRIHMLCEEGVDPDFPCVVRVALADSYAKLGLWKEAKKCNKGVSDYCRAAILAHLGFVLDRKKFFGKARELFVEALKTASETRLWWLGSSIHNSLALGIGKLGDLRGALNELRKVGALPSAMSALISTCYSPKPSEKGSVELDDEISHMIDGTLSDSADRPNQIMWLAVKARFLKKAGLEEKARNVVEKAVGIVTRRMSELERPEADHLAWASAGLCDLLMDSSNNRWLRMWFDTAVTVYDRFGSAYMLNDIGRALKPSIVEDNEWLLSALIDVVARGGYPGFSTDMALRLSSILSSLTDKEIATKHWEHFINSLSHIDLTHSNVLGGPKQLLGQICSCLGKSAVGGSEKVQLVCKLCVATVKGPPTIKPRSRIPDAMRGIIETILESSGFEDKKLALNEILVALPPSADNLWIVTIVAEGLSLLGEKDNAASLFDMSIDLLDEIKEDPVRELETSEIALIMAKHGLSTKARPLLERIARTKSLHLDEVLKNTALGYLYSDGPEAAMSLATECGIEKVRLVVVAEFLVCSLQDHVKSHRPALHVRPVIDNYAVQDSKALLHDVANYLAILTKAPFSTVCDNCLRKVADELRKLSLAEAIRLLASLPSFSWDEEAWEALCADYEYDPEVVRQVLDSMPHLVTKTDLIQSLSDLNSQSISEKLRLILCAHAVLDENCFFEAVCNYLENCKDATILEEVRHELDEIEGIETNAVIEEVPEISEATVTETKDEEPPDYDTLEIRFDRKAKKNKRLIILVNGQQRSRPPTEAVFVRILLLAVARKINKPVEKSTDLLLLTSYGQQPEEAINEIRNFFMSPSFGLKGKVDRLHMPRSVEGVVSLEFFDKHKKSIMIDDSVRWFESQYMDKFEERVDKEQRAIDALKFRKDSDRDDNSPAWDDDDLESELENKVKKDIRRTFRYTRTVMRALEIVGRKFQNDAWMKNWNRLQKKCYKLLQQSRCKDKRIEEYYYLPPQRGYQK